MLSHWLSILALLVIYLGFASVLGVLLHHALARNEPNYHWAGVVFGGALFIPTSLAFPVPLVVKLAAWAGAAASTLLYTLRPVRLPRWLWSPAFGLRYSVLAMALILLWSLAAGFTYLRILLGLLAALAGALAWLRSRQIAPST